MNQLGFTTHRYQTELVHDEENENDQDNHGSATPEVLQAVQLHTMQLNKDAGH